MRPRVGGRRVGAILSTPRGLVFRPRLVAPDFGSEERPRPRGEYALRLILDPASAPVAAFLRQLETLWRAAAEEGRRRFAELTPEARAGLGEPRLNPLTRPFLEGERAAPTGEVLLRFSAPATGADGVRRRRPVIYDAAGRPYWTAPGDLAGREARVAFRPRPYFIAEAGVAGLKLALTAVMLAASGDAPSQPSGDRSCPSA